MTSSSAGAPGRRLGRYHLVEPLGGGPTGAVHRARVHGLAASERQFAVKRFHGLFAGDPAAWARIAAAARSYGSLQHPRVASLHEFGGAGADTFTATELVEGADLGELLAEGLPAGAGAALLVQACRGVACAHGRGLSHLGVCPTNLIATGIGDLKVTDFGFLPARLPADPAADPGLEQRVPYLAPEQLAAGSTSPATDVFQLGLVGYELLVGRRPFPGASAQAIAGGIRGGTPLDPPLPKPLAKVLRRALARSPFERFPDAGSMADAIEAALRAAPLPGGPSETAAAVRRIEERRPPPPNDLSGALSLPLTSPSGAHRTLFGMPALSPPRRQDSVDEAPTTLRDAAPPPARPAARADTLADFSSEPGSRADTIARGDTIEAETNPRARAQPDVALGAAGARPGTEPGQLLGDDEPAVHATPPPGPDSSLGIDDDEVEELESTLLQTLPEFDPGAPLDARAFPGTPPPTSPPASPPATPAAATPPPPAAADREAAPAPGPASAEVLPPSTLAAPGRQRARPGGLRWALYGGVFAALAAASFFAYDLVVEPQSSAAIVQRDAGSATPTASAPAPAPADQADAAAPVAAASPAADAAPPDAPLADELVIDSRPRGAKVYVDGSLVGKTPQTLDATSDRHTLALIHPGYELHTAEIDGRGRVEVALEEVTPPGGPAGIKVRCRKKNRYYVFVDGHAVGQLCPTERIGVELGRHEVEIYDPITDSRRSFRVSVEETRLSLRVRVD